jgi:hypothetical protein
MQIIIRNCDIIGQFLCSHLSTEDFLLKSKTNTMGLNFVDTELVASVIKDFLTMEIE